MGEVTKSLVFGGLDGILTTFAIVSGVVGAGLANRVIVILGFANLLADAVSMGMGDFLSTMAENSHVRSELKRESWECENYLEGEKQEMVDIYTAKGMSEEDAREFIDILAGNRELFINTMMVEELGILPEEESALKNGLTTFTAFVVFGVMPLFVYLLSMLVNWVVHKEYAKEEKHRKHPFEYLDEVEDWSTFAVATLVVLLTLFVLGALKSKVTNQRWYWSGIITVFYGGLAASIAYGIGKSMSYIPVSHVHHHH